ncbi:Nuclear envelope morphology protein 1 [Basidiobolus ranarum]|uniref:Nuclear envelope morphology protein 1 n=1 Tax=Basidiobolus ranarum TaxID=34480 RepID=A0ABR2VVP5_9FUNG
MELQIQSPALNTPLSFDAGVFAAAAAAAAVSMDKEETRNRLSGYLRSSPVGRLSKALYSGATCATSFILTSLGSLYKGKVSFPKPIPSFSAPIPTTEKKTLVLDLDETLIHSMMKESGKPHFQVNVPFDKQSCIYYVYQRPNVFEFLHMVSQWYTLVIFTASVAEYADPIIDWLEDQVMAKYGLHSEIFAKRLYREDCTYRNGVFMKDLAIVDSDLSNVLLVDNSPFSYAINQNNAVPIKTWMNDDLYDECLSDLIPFLDALSGVEDVRSILSLRSPSPQSTCKSAI